MTDYKKGLWTSWAVMAALVCVGHYSDNVWLSVAIAPACIWLVHKNDPANKREKK